ncbi:actin-like ATPase domain-containing protein [Rhizodiscina lignyota]|uniref:Actin-like ATPase domain-containing protein n=1 Tax=Rhizodiscina lignyota TaxID=1504668 RepID=A0A9P4M915_9PEZI|nr:actin-like ATPase domain-containing protein [Rhizodiscina lignyota]
MKKWFKVSNSATKAPSKASPKGKGGAQASTAPAESTVDRDPRRLVIGLDFGTTFSGIAFAFAGKPEEIHCVLDWPGATGRQFPKAPTLVQYGKQGFAWGYQVEPTAEGVVSCVKLLLDPGQSHQSYDPKRMFKKVPQPPDLPKAPVDIATDYIRAMYSHALVYIEQKLGKEYMELLSKEFVLTVPAVWSDKAKDLTIKAAEGAGFSPVTLIKEPEAAALFTIHQLQYKTVNVGDAVVVVDAGGGTADLLTYEIQRLNPMKLKELAAPMGGIIGSTLINRLFEDWIKLKVGPERHATLSKTEAYRSALKTFDQSTKVQFESPGADQFVSFAPEALNNSEPQGIKNNFIKLTGTDLGGFFEPSCTAIAGLVAKQIGMATKRRNKVFSAKCKDAIFLVGGFGESKCLKHHVSFNNTHIEVIQPIDAWSAIVKGAVLSKLPREVIVESTIAPRHYGVITGTIYDPQKHQGQNIYEAIWDQTLRVDEMLWFIHKNEDIVMSREKSQTFFHNLPNDPTRGDFIREYVLMMCDEDDASKYPDDTVRRCCKLNVDLKGIPKTSIQKLKRPSDGLKYSKVNFKLIVRSQGARMVFSYECGGKEYGSVEAIY